MQTRKHIDHPSPHFCSSSAPIFGSCAPLKILSLATIVRWYAYAQNANHENICPAIMLKLKVLSPCIRLQKTQEGEMHCSQILYMYTYSPHYADFALRAVFQEPNCALCGDQVYIEVFGCPHGVSYYTGENEGPRHSELGKLLTHSSEVSESEFSATTSLAGQQLVSNSAGLQFCH